MDISKLRGRTFTSQQELQQALTQLFNDDVAEYNRQLISRGGVASSKFKIEERNLYPLLMDCIQEAGGFPAGEGYFYQDIWGARKVYESGAKLVYDIGSRMDGHISHLLSMNVNVVMLDIRPFSHQVDGLSFIQADAMDLSNIPDNSIQTLTSLCALEHFGLGRYSDPVVYDGWQKSLLAIKRKIKVGGHFYLSVPVGSEEKVCFNAHRVFHPTTIIDTVAPELEIEEFSYIKDWKIHTVFSGKYDIDILERVTNTALDNRSFKNGFMGLFAFRKVRVAEDNFN